MNNLKVRLDQLLKKTLDQYKLPGFALGVTSDREIIYAEAYGVRNVETGELLQPAHIFHMASISKTFVVTAVLQLVEQGRLILSQPIASILPYFKMRDYRRSLKHINYF